METITTTAQLAQFCARAAKYDFVTVDTEFLRESTYWPKLCLLQAATSDEAVLIDPPRAFRLGSTITATRRTETAPAIRLPTSALLEKDGKEQVWIVDPSSSSVARREIDVATRDGATFTVAGGLEAGARVVTAGVHSLIDGQKVKLLQGDVR